MSEMKSTKSYVIAKRAVWEAYQQVKANRGAAGIDEETIAMFDQNLPRNLYKLWNRMSSGSYLPPPVKQVEIPKAGCPILKLVAQQRALGWDSTIPRLPAWSYSGSLVGVERNRRHANSPQTEGCPGSRF